MRGARQAKGGAPGRARASPTTPLRLPRWADRYAAQVNEQGAVDAAVAADVLAQVAGAVPAWRDAQVVLAGFLDHAPQQARLVAALQAAGMRVDRIELPQPRASTLRRVVAATPRAEIEAALCDARTRALADPQARIGIVVGDLDDRRPDVMAAAEDILCPELAAQPGAGGARPYSVSLGTRLRRRADRRDGDGAARVVRARRCRWTTRRPSCVRRIFRRPTRSGRGARASNSHGGGKVCAT